MTTNEIIKALKIRIETQKKGEELFALPQGYLSSLDCEILNLINRQKADTIKAFADRMRNAFPEGNRDNKSPAIYADFYYELIDQIEQEMTEDRNNG